MTEDDLARAHSERFRAASNRYARRVGEAYDWDLAAVGRHDDEPVAARVAEWERAQGLEPTDWTAQGESERDPDDDYGP